MLVSVTTCVRRSILTLAVGFCSLTLLGCGSAPTGPKLVAVSGTVSFDGTPIPEGRILFRKTDGDCRAFSADVKDGSYQLEAEPGHMSVVITASRLIPGKFDDSNGTPEPVGEMYIPPQYNDATLLVADVKDAGGNVFPFELSSAKLK